MNSLFKALNDKTRRDILELLKKKDMTAGEIADHFDMTKPSISHHLDLLKQAELIEADKQGQFIIYSLNTSVLDEIVKWFVQLNGKSDAKKSTTAHRGNGHSAHPVRLSRGKMGNDT
ncbi:MAG: winged helix-turn-helix transcriptional regulator [Flavipsychrobacter sp.]|nr:winged helix-turn-helix transcriptional regulator [Flavipsychrobacter sp.]